MATGSEFGPPARGRGEMSFRGRERESPRLVRGNQTTEGGIFDADDDVFGGWEENRGAWHRGHQPGPSTQRAWDFQETDTRSSWREGPRRESNSANQELTFRNDRRLSSEPVPRQRYGDIRGRGYSHRVTAFTSCSISGERSNLSADDATWRRTQLSAERGKLNDNLKGIIDSQSASKANKPDVRKPGDAMPACKLEVGDGSKGGKRLLLDDEAEDGSGADSKSWRRTSRGRGNETRRQGGSHDAEGSGWVTRDFFRRPGVRKQAASARAVDDIKGFDYEAENGSGADSKSWRRTSRGGGGNDTKRQGGSHNAEGSDWVTRDLFRRPGVRKQAASVKAENDTECFEEPCDLPHGDPRQERSDSESEVTDTIVAIDTRSKGRRAEFQFHPKPEVAFQASVPTLVPPRRHDTKRRTRVPALSEQDLRSLLDKTPSDVLVELAKKKDQFLSLLDGDELPDKTLLLTVRVVTRVTDLDQKLKFQYSKELNTVFSMIESSLFTSKHLTRYIVSSSANQPAEYHDNTSSVQRLSVDFSTILKFLQLILEYKPSACPEVGVALILLQKEVTSASLNKESFDLKGCLMTEVEQVTEICSSLSESQRMAKRRKFEKPPPNNFRDIPIFPKSRELRETGQPFLRKNIIRGKYDNVEHYLDVQFRLLREDFVAPLREGVIEFLSDSSRRPRDIRIYYNVTIEGTEMVRHQLVHTLSFELRRKRPEHWESSKRLLYGSFVCLTADAFEHIYCATIADRNVNDLSKGLVNVCFLTPLNRTTHGPFIMAESSAYFEAYHHVLLGLQEIQLRNFSFKKYIVDASFKVDPPSYLQDGDVYDMRSLVVGSDESFNYDVKTDTFVNSAFIPILELGSWPLAEDLHLDDSQKAALHTALTKEFAIIQGPPGTGKTYIGLKIVELLLYNAPWKYNHDDDENASPILVVCYTNHALDQFLEGIIAFGEENVVRVGGRSSSQILETKNISVVRRNMPHDKGEYRERMTRLKNLESEHENLEKTIQSLILKQQLPKRAIMNLMALSDCIKPTHYEELLPEHEELGKKDAIESNGHSKESMKRSSENLLKWLKVDFSIEENEKAGYEGSKADEQNDRIDVDVERDAIQRERQLDDMTDWEVPQTKIDTIFIENAAHDVKSTLDTSSVEELQKKETMTDWEVNNVERIWLLEPHDRWRLYRSWVRTFKEVLETNLLKHREKYQECSDEIDGLREKENLKVLRESSVVGMTTTGAARHRSLLQLLGPRVVVVEEAAEVLEAHIITTLSSKCQHLILIGDHQQLKPNPTVYRLAKVFNLDTSLFERMINNSMQCQSLMHQHRMRPEISLLMRKHFYRRIEDDESVLGRDDIKGVERNVFFITHEQLEDAVDDNKTRSNQYEAKVLVALCKYLLQQGYGPSQITILTTYTGQLFCFRRLMDKMTFEGVRVCVVDNFQGEENDIILLSLVRSNEHGSIGFLRTSNRVCVALSRAKLGLYCIGNATILKKAHIWQEIIGTLEAENQIGASMPLVCQNHPATKTQVATADDFKQKAPCGGCDINCDFRLPCGHVCSLFCHPFDPEHREYKCMKSCERLCERRHPCLFRCYELCKPCGVEVSKVMPKCSHKIKFPCYKYDTITCPRPCQTQFEECHHFCPKECGQPCPETCPGKCEKTLPCDHACTEPCGSPCTSYCTVKVEKLLEDCGHTIVTDCGKWNTSCPKQCEKMLECGHRCAEKCGESCTKYCKVEVEKILPTCGHGIIVECSEHVKDIKCTTLVQKTRSKCGHKITLPCSVDIDYIETEKSETLPSQLSRTYRLKFKLCKEIVEKTHTSCGHITKLPCHQDVVSVPCSHICRKLLTCGHRCPKNCSEPCPEDRFRARGSLLRNALTTLCRERCKRLLACGHPCPNECGMPCQGASASQFGLRSNSTKCKVLVDKVLPECGHSQAAECWEDIASLSCSRPCKKKLPCGHVCTLLCGEPCVCRQEVLRRLPKCYHYKWLPCHQDVESYICQEKCMRVLACGHKRFFNCWEPCPVESSDLTDNEEALSSSSRSRMTNRYSTTRICVEFVTKRFAGCGHNAKLECYKDIKMAICSEKCNRILACGHPCPNKCGEPCPGSKLSPEAERLLRLRLTAIKPATICTRMVQKDLRCGHRQDAECWQADSDLSCRRKCTGILECGHICRGTCFSCKNGTQHVECKERCKRQLLCGHACVQRCATLCSSECNKCNSTTSQAMFDVRPPGPCKHNIWNRHLKSHACILPCRQNRPCKHPCMGVCGEPCPQFCRVCDKNKVLTKLSTKHIRPKDTFICLVDCGHLCETRVMDTMMSRFQATLESGWVEVKSALCPKCKEPILHCPRYQYLLNIIKSYVDAARRKASARPRRVGFGRRLYAAEPDEDSEKFSFAVGRWMRCPQGHVFYVEENMKEQQKPSCPECTKLKEGASVKDDSPYKYDFKDGDSLYKYYSTEDDGPDQDDNSDRDDNWDGYVSPDY